MLSRMAHLSIPMEYAVITVMTYTVGERKWTPKWTKDIVYLGTKEVAEVDPDGAHVTLVDHLGTPRFEVRANQSVVEQKFAPFGESLTDPTAAGKFAKGFTNHEQTDPSGLIYTQARFYAPMYGRFLSPDPARDQHFEETQSWNIYSYVRNQPTMQIDPTGLEAWEIKKKWDNQQIKSYRAFVAKNADTYKGKYTCEDYPLAMTIDFASKNGLPMQIKTDSGVFNAKSDAYSSVDQFKGDVLSHAGAPDLQKAENTKPIALKDVAPGDTLLKRDSQGLAMHVQLVVGANAGSIDIRQGNSGLLNIFRGASRLGASDPKSIFYTGQSVQSGTYNLFNGGYTRDGNVTPNAINNFRLDPRVWNFMGWNK